MPDNKIKYNALGLVSGTSLDGLDIAYCTFISGRSGWEFRINHANTYPYPDNLKNKLAHAHDLDGFSLMLLHKSYGKYIGQKVNGFIRSQGCKPELISSHGHTVFHQPDKALTFQIGDGNTIAAETGITTVSDFRSLDVALGGEGAPLVPIGDKLLFSEYEFCLNLGGFSNISYETTGGMMAFDPSPVNLAINYLMEFLNKDYDKDGETGRKGDINKKLLNELDQLPYYLQNPPKSLGKEWVDKKFKPILNKYDIVIKDKLRTVYEHIANQVTRTIRGQKPGKLLATGGGANNIFLIERIQANSDHQIIVPDQLIVNFKEALIFAFLGVLRLRNETNCLATVTGAKTNNIGGSIVTR